MQQITGKIQGTEKVFVVDIFADLIQAYGNRLLSKKWVLVKIITAVFFWDTDVEERAVIVNTQVHVSTYSKTSDNGIGVWH
ncbi:MAG: Uncharacterised protein [Flavobacteriaceae bacterium]|nr:MAG: Uncharacterised protein [Flavobacteriaceae bacterium]